MDQSAERIGEVRYRMNQFGELIHSNKAEGIKLKKFCNKSTRSKFFQKYQHTVNF